MKTTDGAEKDICHRIATNISRIISMDPSLPSDVLQAIRSNFDEMVVVGHLTEHRTTASVLPQLFEKLRALQMQTYENKPLAFGCIVEREGAHPGEEFLFPEKFFDQKRYRALSDGYRTAYRIDAAGTLCKFLTLDAMATVGLRGKHWFPEWAGPLAVASQRIMPAASA